MTYEEMAKFSLGAVDELKAKLGNNGTVIVMLADETGTWAANWSWAHPLIALGLAKLGTDSIDNAIRKPASSSGQK